MNKLSIAVLLFSSLYLATALSDAPWVPISRGIFENSPFTQGLNIIGTLNNLGQAYDSGIFNARAGDASTVYNAWHQTDDDGAFTYIAEPLLALADETAHNSKYAVRIDPETGRRDVVWWSIQQLLEENFVPTGRNITYDADTDTVTVTSFDGIEQFVEYQRFQPLNETNTPPTNDTTDVVVDPNENTEVIVDPAEDAEVVVDDGENSEVVVDGEDNEVIVDADDDVDVVVNGTNNTSNTPTVQVYNSFREYLRDFVGYEERDVNDLNGDEFLDNAVGRAIGQLAEDGNLANVNLTNVNTLDTILDQDRNTLVRIAGDITSDTHNGNIVAVIFCAVDSNCDAGDLQYWWWNSILNGGESQ